MSFDSQNRNLTDPAIYTALKRNFGDHARKITYALSIWAMKGTDPHEGLKVAIDLAINLKRGREPTMYTDLLTNPDRVQIPSEIIRPTAASDAVKLAEKCLTNAYRHIREEAPTKFTIAQDRLFTMKQKKFQSILNTEDFWWYYISRIENEQQDIADAVLVYERDFILAGKRFHEREAPPPKRKL